MEVEKRVSYIPHDNRRKLYLRNDYQCLCLATDDLDMYFTFYAIDGNKSFEITKENYFIYEKFLELYNNIENNNLFEVDESDIVFSDVKTVEDLENLYEEKKELNEWEKGPGHYDKLFHDGIITIKSDDSDDKFVSIEKEEDSFKFTFSENPVQIRLKESKSYYGSYNILLLEAFGRLMEYDPNDKQIHMEEYLYNQKRAKVKKR